MVIDIIKELEEHVRQNYFVEKLPHAEYDYRYDGWIALVSYDGKIFDAPTERTKLDNEFRERAPKILAAKIRLYNWLLEEKKCLYCDKKMSYLNVFGYQYQSDGTIDGVICENKKCQKQAGDEEIFATWEETKKDYWPNEDEFWGGPVDEVADLIRPFKTKEQTRKETDILLKKTEEDKKQKKEELEKELEETEKTIKELLEKYRNTAPELESEKLRIALSLIEFLVDNWSDYLIAKNLLRKNYNGY